MPKVYYGLHFSEGVAEYLDPKAEPYRIFIGESAIKNMAPTFQGRPVYVQHVDEVNLKDIQGEADGYVVESFFNRSDGKYWVKFIVVSDRGHQAISNKWKLSNAYHIRQSGQGGLWHGVEYAKEVVAGEYDHLAIVDSPRYEESIILTPEEFKTYNDQKEQELRRLINSNDKGDSPMKGLSFFTKKKVENQADYESLSVMLPKSKREVTIAQLCNEADDAEEKKKNGQQADMGHLVKVGNEDMTVGDLLNAYNALKEQNASDEADESAKEAQGVAEGVDSAELAEEEKKLNEEKAAAEKKDAEEKKMNELRKKREHFEKLKNAKPKNDFDEDATIMLSNERVALGKKRYGSAN